MALDTVILNPGAGGNSIGVDDIGGVDYEVVKQAFGVAGDLNLVSEDDPLPVIFPSEATASLANVAYSATNVTLRAGNAARKMVVIYNDADKSLYIKFGATASATSFTVKVLAGGYFELPIPVYSGIIDGIWDAAGSGAARVTEW